ncbi:MAG TPA: ABC transporter substrate-binding protein [Bacillus bacterium]|uniref:ABC transporter substrate-binding lipoprotein YvrC n=2 Tax=Siminovitchia fordii TaxID=254759 RepID=A0ABQ4K3E9_9BACI|nr:ABC transporter substrate-binding protein [Siminovitchia fordii]GIN20275.1 putative ABC transporter substrate-binding lipoprotein YvrC [Siminovitchia fordii]HBZ08463.1 ABC transporter substrate-binding protein [Bacillus sp. (in: firmicutes)]
MKKVYSLLAALMLIGLLAACGNNESMEEGKQGNTEPKTEQVAKDSFPVTLKDAADKEITIEKKPEKIISLIPSNTEILYALGAGDEVVGVSENDNYPEDVKDKEQVAGLELNIEKIISLKPDLVLAHGSAGDMWESGLKQLEDSGITVLVVHNAESFDEVYDTIDFIAKATGHTEEASDTINDMKAKLDEIEKKAADIKEEDQKSVFVEISPAPEIYAAGKNTFMDEMLKTINAKNSVQEEGWPMINEEAIIKMNPEVIIVNYNYVDNAVDQVLDREGWQDVAAIKGKQVYTVDENLVSRSGPRIVEGVEELAKAVYPDVFKE